MANLHDRNSNHRDGNVDETVHLNGNADPARATSYRDGYVHGRVAESRIEEDRLEVRDNNNAARGLFIGILLTSLLGITLAALYYWNQRQQVEPAIVVPVPTSPAPAANQQPNRQTTVIERQVDQVPQVVPSMVMLGYLASSVQSADFATLKLLNTYLGNGLSSRLFVELREKRGLAYEVSAFYPTRLDTSNFVVYMGTAPENTALAVEGLRAEVDRLCTTELSSDELQSCKNKLLGQYALGKQTNAQLAQVFGWYETLGLGIEFDTRFQEQVSNVTPEMAQQAACRYFIEPYLSLVGPEKAVNALVAPAVG
jgi:hypothetical protein